MRTSLLAAVVGVIAALTWQALVVHYLYGGNWTGLYYAGEHFPQRPPLAERIWTFPNSDGYDGQWYHYIAHDPWFQRGYVRFLDAPRLRYHRILIPGLANALAGGRDRYVDRMYTGLILLSVFLGSLWLGWYARLHGFTRIVTNHRASNRRIIDLNKKFGFKIIRRRRTVYYEDPPEPTVVMELRLRKSSPRVALMTQ